MPRAIFFTLRFWEPRGVVRFALGVAFFRAARFAFLRSSLLSDFVFAIELQVSEFEVIEVLLEFRDDVISNHEITKSRN